MIYASTESGAALPVRLSPAETNTAGRIGRDMAELAAEHDGQVTVRHLAERGHTPDQLAAFGLHGAAFAARRRAEEDRR